MPRAERKTLLDSTHDNDDDEPEEYDDDEMAGLADDGSSEWCGGAQRGVLVAGSIFLLVALLAAGATFVTRQRSVGGTIATVDASLAAITREGPVPTITPAVATATAAAASTVATVPPRLTPRLSPRARRAEGRGHRRRRRGRREGKSASASAAGGRHAPPPLAPHALVHTHVVPQGGSLAVECAAGTSIRRVRFATFGTPVVHANGSVGVGACHSARSQRVIEHACLGQSHCCLPVTTENFASDPCRGTIKTLAVVLEGCDEHRPYTRYKRHCSLLGQPLLCDEDIEFLTTLALPPAPTPLLPHVALMVDTSWRPALQHFVVHNVRAHAGGRQPCRRQPRSSAAELARRSRSPGAPARPRALVRAHPRSTA